MDSNPRRKKNRAIHTYIMDHIYNKYLNLILLFFFPLSGRIERGWLAKPIIN